MRTRAPAFVFVVLLAGCASVAPDEVPPSQPPTLPVAAPTAELPPPPSTALSVATAPVPAATPTRASVAATRVPAPTGVRATPSVTAVASLYPEAMGDPSEHVALVLASYWPPPHGGKGPNCGWYQHADLSLPHGDELLVFDDEAKETGINRWSASAPYFWIGELESLVAALDGIELVKFSDATAWVILYDPDWAGGWHYAREVRRIVTPGGNSLWYRDDTQAVFPGDCESVSHEGPPDKWGP